MVWQVRYGVGTWWEAWSAPLHAAVQRTKVWRCWRPTAARRRGSRSPWPRAVQLRVSGGQFGVAWLATRAMRHIPMRARTW